MNTRTVATFVLAVASVAGVQAQADLPNQWLDHQMKAAKLDQGGRSRNAAVAVNAAGAKAAATPELATQAPAVLTHQTPRPVANVAVNSVAAQK